MAESDINQAQGDRLCQLMSDCGVDNKALAKKCGISDSTVSLWRKGHDIRAQYLAIICPYLGTTSDYLLFGAGDFSPLEYKLVSVARQLSATKQQSLLRFLTDLLKN